MTREARLSEIVVDDDVNVRAALDEATVEHYREVLDSCPPPVVFDTGEGLLLADGFHRLEAATREGRESVTVECRSGGRPEAIAFAATANLTHGKPLTKPERVEAVRRVKEIHPDWGKKRLAKATRLPATTVGRYLAQLERGPVDPYERAVAEGNDLVVRIEDTWHMLAGLYRSIEAGVVDENGESWGFDQVAEDVGMTPDELHAFIDESPSLVR